MGEYYHFALGPTLIEKYIQDDTLSTKHHPLPCRSLGCMHLKAPPLVEALPIGYLVIDEIIDITLKITSRIDYVNLLRESENHQRRLKNLPTSEQQANWRKKARDEEVDLMKRLILMSILVDLKDGKYLTKMTILM